MDYGNCDKCGHSLERHYIDYCPLCDVNKFEIKDKKIYDLFMIMAHMEAKGFMSEERYWREYVLESYPQIRNDIYINFWLGCFGDDEEINQYHRQLSEFFGFDPEEEKSVIMRISW